MSCNPFKRCFKCGITKPLEEFYRHPRMADGHLNKCKSCAKLDVVRNRAKKLDYYQEYDRQRSNLPHRVEGRRRYGKHYQVEFANQYRATYAVKNAVRDGRLQRQPCELCGAKAEGHHTDYSKPLDVRWPCPKHHHAQHRKYDYEKLLAEQ